MLDMGKEKNLLALFFKILGCEILWFLEKISVNFVHLINYSNPELIFLTDGASKGVMQILNTIIRDDKDGVCKLALFTKFS